MNDYDIDPGVSEAIERFKLPESLGFGLVDAPVMFEASGAVAHACSSIMPTQSGRSLYLRPFLFGTEKRRSANYIIKSTDYAHWRRPHIRTLHSREISRIYV